jgi:hypothetical protein
MKQNSEKLTAREVGIVKFLLIQGFHHKRIASLLDCNQGRVSEINSGLKYKSVPPYAFPEWKTYPIKKRGD